MPSSKLSQLAETLIGSEIVKLGADIKEKMAQGNKIYNFTIGDFDSSIFPGALINYKNSFYLFCTLR